MKKLKVLFLLKRRQDYGNKEARIELSTGLINSSSFVNDMLKSEHIDAHLAVINDNNDIDREVAKYKPTHVIIEALWVVPDKFDILSKLHPTVKWIIRFHSEIPFLAQEGNAMEWISKYVNHPNVYIAFNASRILESMRYYLKDVMNWNEYILDKKVLYLPNYYPTEFDSKSFDADDEHKINISCFGAIRPLKNQLNQALAAIIFANNIKKKLRFHINTGRCEQRGDSVYKNIVGLFANLEEHKLITHEWMPHGEFLRVCAKMDIALQVSFSETFNIIAADTLSQGVPLVASNEIPWSNPRFNAHPTDTNEIVKALMHTFYFPQENVRSNQHSLKEYAHKTKHIWLEYFDKL